MIKHTPGPWRIEPQKHGAAHYDLPILADAACSAVALACDLYGKDGGALTRDANARLIAAAPELLEALHVVAQYFVSPDGGNPEHTEAVVKAAIAKAEGLICPEQTP